MCDGCHTTMAQLSHSNRTAVTCRMRTGLDHEPQVPVGEEVGEFERGDFHLMAVHHCGPPFPALLIHPPALGAAAGTEVERLRPLEFVRHIKNSAVRDDIVVFYCYLAMPYRILPRLFLHHKGSEDSANGKTLGNLLFLRDL